MKKQTPRRFLVGMAYLLSARVIFAVFFMLLTTLLWVASAQDSILPIQQYDKFERQFDVAGDYENPYDPRQVEVTARFSAPDGEEILINGFYTDSDWFIRFTPHLVGNWSYVIEASIRGAAPSEIESGEFQVEPSDSKGFIETAGRYFQFENGDSYFPVGQNLGWSWDEGGGLGSYLRWLDDLAASGANYARLYADTAWFIGLDWAGEAGNYSADQPDAAALDTILEAAEARGIYLQVVLIYHRSFVQYRGLPVTPPADIPRPDISTDFDSHPYSQVNGGPMSQPSSFFSDLEVDRLLRQKLRYMVARWGYSPHIFAWEVITNVDELAGYDEDEAAFIVGLADYVREVDPYNHLVTLGSREPLPELWNGVDFVQVRSYQTRPIEDAQDQTTLIQREVATLLNQTDKPVLLTEFSLSAWFEPLADDPNGIHIRNTIWSSALSGAAGSGMTWWWDTYIAPQNLYPIYTPLVRFSEGLDWQHLEVVAPALIAENPEAAYEPIRIDDFNRSSNYISPPDSIYTLTSDGTTPLSSQLSSRIYGSRTNVLGNRPQTFILTAPIDTVLTIAVDSDNAILQITLDNQIYTTLEVSSSTAINVPISAGEHRLVLDNLGEGWVEFDYLEIRDYLSPLRVRALADHTQGVVTAWIEHRAYTWQNADADITPETYQLLIPNMPAGVYRIEFWDTFTGNVLGQEMTTTTNGDLLIPLLPINTQLAIRVFRVETLASESTPITPAPTRTPLISLTPTASNTPTFTPSATTTSTATQTPSFTPTNQPSLTPSNTASPTPTRTNTPTNTLTSTVLPTETNTPESTQTILATPSPTTVSSPTPSPTTEAEVPRQTRTPRP